MFTIDSALLESAVVWLWPSETFCQRLQAVGYLVVVDVADHEAGAVGGEESATVDSSSSSQTMAAAIA